MRDLLFTEIFYSYVRDFWAMEQAEPDHGFVEIVNVGRHYHWFSDVTVYYHSRTMSKF